MRLHHGENSSLSQTWVFLSYGDALLLAKPTCCRCSTCAEEPEERRVRLSTTSVSVPTGEGSWSQGISFCHSNGNIDPGAEQHWSPFGQQQGSQQFLTAPVRL